MLNLQIRLPDGLTTGWVPSYVLNLLTANPRRPVWTFKKFRKPSFGKKDSKSDLHPDNVVVGGTGSVQCVCGESASLTIDVNPEGGLPHGSLDISWRSPSGHVVLPASGKYATHVEGEKASIVVTNCELADAGEYQCIVTNRSTGAVMQYSAILSVICEYKEKHFSC